MVQFKGALKAHGDKVTRVLVFSALLHFKEPKRETRFLLRSLTMSYRGPRGSSIVSLSRLRSCWTFVISSM